MDILTAIVTRADTFVRSALFRDACGLVALLIFAAAIVSISALGSALVIEWRAQ